MTASAAGPGRDGRGTSVLAAVRAGHGLVLLTASALPVTSADRVVRTLAGVLGARHLAQGVTELLAPRRMTSPRSAFVDGSHAASMLGWALVDPRHRRVALLSASIASLFAVAELRLRSRAPRR